MKYLFAFILSGLLTACSTDNGITDISEEGEYSIGFSALSNGNIGTRSVGDQTPANLSEMAVFAYMTTGMAGERGDAGGLLAPVCGGYFQRNVSISKAATSGGTQTSGGVRMGFGALGTDGIAGVGGAGSNGQTNGVAGGGGGAGGSAGQIQGGSYCNFWSSGAGGSSYVGDNGITVAGFESMVQPNGTTDIGHTGDGYARITLVR